MYPPSFSNDAFDELAVTYVRINRLIQQAREQLLTLPGFLSSIIYVCIYSLSDIYLYMVDRL
jgi:hypothetical protein